VPAEVTVLRAPTMDPARVNAGFSTRRGGVSEPPFDELDLGSREDDPGAVAANVLRFARACELSRCPPAVQRQVHGREITWVGGEDGPDPREVRDTEADALLTRAAGLPVGVLTADCVPVLLWDPDHGVVAAVHAGWRGTAAGIVGAAIEAMAERAGTRAAAVQVAIGPAIGRCCYHVGPEVVEQLTAAIPGERWLARDEDGSPRVDLREANRLTLRGLGVAAGAIALVGGCTCCDPDHFSYRGDGPRTGRQMGVIELR
jgi:polyphenol oxidase